MNSTIKNILAVVLGWLLGNVINMGLIHTGLKLLPIDGIDPSNIDMEQYAAIMPTLDFKYFIFPFLAHALGTLVGAIIAGWIATSSKMKFSISIGILFLLGGVYMSFMIKGPIWFTIIDLVFAYIPMALLGGKIAKKLSKNGREN